MSSAINEIYLRKRQQMLKIVEVYDTTEQLYDAVARKDQVSTRMLLSMRGEPLQSAFEIEQSIKNYITTIPEEEAIRAGQLLAGAEAETEEEKKLCEQITKNDRLLKKCSELDRQISIQLGQNKSYYRKFRPKA